MREERGRVSERVEEKVEGEQAVAKAHTRVSYGHT